MFIKRALLPKWCLKHSHFLNKLYEDNENEEYIFIPILLQYDQSYDFSEMFEQDLPYLRPPFFYIYFDGLIFLDFIQFDLSFDQLLKPQMYTFLPFSDEIKKSIKSKTTGLQHHAFGLSSYTYKDPKNDFKNKDNLNELKQSIQANQLHWIKWFIHRFEDKDNIGENHILQSIDSLFDIDFTNVSVETFDLLQNELYVQPFSYPNVCENIVTKRNVQIFEKYKNKIYEFYDYETLFKIAFVKNKNESDESQVQFIEKMMLNKKLFHFDYNTIQYTLDSNNLVLMNYIYDHFYDSMKYAIMPIHKKLYNLSIKKDDISYDLKYKILDFLFEKYRNVLTSEFIIDNVYIKNNDLYDHQGEDTYFDYPFITHFIKKIGMEYNSFTYTAATLLGIQNIIDNYHAHFYNSTTQSYNIIGFRNKFRLVIRSANVDNIRFFIKNRLYVNDDIGYTSYLEYASYHIDIFKLLYENGFRNINDDLFIEIFNQGKCDIASYVIQQKFKPSKQTMDFIKNQVERILKIKNMKNSIDIISKFSDEQIKIYNMIR